MRFASLTFALVAGCSAADSPPPDIDLGSHVEAHGSLTLADRNDCGPAGAVPSRCLGGTVRCPGVADLDVRLRVSEPAGAAIGTIVFGTGGGGGAFYEQSFGDPA